MFLAQGSQQKDEDYSSYAIARELKNTQRTVKEIERRNNELTTELDKAKQSTTESVNLNKSHVRRIQQLENELSQVKHMNRSLMRENEAFQLLLHEKNPIMQRNDSRKVTDTVEKVTKGAPKDESSSPQEDDLKNSDLATEFDRAFALSTSPLGERVHKESDHTIIEKEIKSLKDENKSLKLYIEKILNRIMESQAGFEEILLPESKWKKPAVSNPATPTTRSFSFNINQEEKDNNKTKKIEKRKTLSGWHFRSASQPQNGFKNDKIISEEPDQIHPLPRKSNDDTINLSDAPKNSNRFSLFNWGSVKEEEKKEDPFMRPMILVREEERKE